MEESSEAQLRAAQGCMHACTEGGRTAPGADGAPASFAPSTHPPTHLRAVVDGEHHLVAARRLERLYLVHNHRPVGCEGGRRREGEHGSGVGACMAATINDAQVSAAAAATTNSTALTKVDDGLGHGEGEGAEARTIPAGERRRGRSRFGGRPGERRRRLWQEQGQLPAGPLCWAFGDRLASMPCGQRGPRNRPRDSGSTRGRSPGPLAHPPTSTSALGAFLPSAMLRRSERRHAL